MLIVFIKTFILYIVVFLVMRLMGKRELSKVQPFELVIIILIADLAASPMASRTMSLLDGIIPIVTLLVCYIVFTFLIQSSNKVQQAVCGNVVLLVENGKILEKELREQHYTISDLMSQLRQKDVFKIQDVKFAILETNGNLNVVLNKDNLNNVPLNIIEDGMLNDNNLQILGLQKDKVDNILKKDKLKLQDILVGTIDENNKFVYQLIDKNL